MAAENIIQKVGKYLFAEEKLNVYAVLDGASIPDLLLSLYERKPEYECLFRGELEPDMQEVAPYLIRLERGSKFTDWVIGKGWGKHWGIFAVSQADMRAMRRHFRTFLMVHDPDGKPIYFRYYDPRVLRVYLPTCNAEELKTVFGPVNYYLLEDEDENKAIRFGNTAGVLQQDKLELVKIG